MRNIKLIIQFDGTAYHGWQTQSSHRTVQKTVQDVLSRILNSRVTLHGSGRTDAGVHALGQAAHFFTTSAMSPEKLLKGLNRLLPADISITQLEEAAPDFNSRFSAQSRVYRYLIWNCPEKSPFYCRYSWHIRSELNILLMKEAAQHLIGAHDFSSFQGPDKEKVNPCREVLRVRFMKARKHLLIAEIEAGSFLRHMVRNIMGTLVDVGLGRLSAQAFKEILEKRDRRCAGEPAPAQGLFLKEVKY
ncbi:MAG: tRNA pseudouridine(38-40) synthase TruA [Pseudomonadota bacterium]